MIYWFILSPFVHISINGNYQESKIDRDAFLKNNFTMWLIKHVYKSNFLISFPKYYFNRLNHLKKNWMHVSMLFE